MADAKKECIIGLMLDYQGSELLTLSYLLRGYVERNSAKYTLADYCDKSVEETDFIRFNYCPDCGKKINWEAIKRGADNAAD